MGEKEIHLQAFILNNLIVVAAFLVLARVVAHTSSMYTAMSKSKISLWTLYQCKYQYNFKCYTADTTGAMVCQCIKDPSSV